MGWGRGKNVGSGLVSGSHSALIGYIYHVIYKGNYYHFLYKLVGT